MTTLTVTEQTATVAVTAPAVTVTVTTARPAVSTGAGSVAVAVAPQATTLTIAPQTVTVTPTAAAVALTLSGGPGPAGATGAQGPAGATGATGAAGATGPAGVVAATAPIVYDSGTQTVSHAASGVTAATYGSSTAIPVLTINASGHVTLASTASIVAGVDGSGSAGRVAQWLDADTLQAANLIAPDNLLTLVAGGAYTLTVPATGTAALLATSNLFTVRQDIRASGSGFASGLYVPWVSGDTAPIVTVGSSNDLNNTTCLYCETGSGTALDLRATNGGTAGVLVLSNAQTSNVRQIAVIRRSSTGTVATGFGVRMTYQLQSSTTANQNALFDDTVWTNATHASRTSERRTTLMLAGVNVEALRIDYGGGTAGNTGLMLYDVDNATLERVTVGAADSGGVGFKVLRIPN